MKKIKVLVGTPICESKMYSWGEYSKAINSIMKGVYLRVVVVDTSDEESPSMLGNIGGVGLSILRLKNTPKKPMDKVVCGRQAIVRYAKNNNYDYVFFVDSDVIIKPDTLFKLLQHKADIVSGFYPITTADGMPTPCAKYAVEKPAPLIVCCGGYRTASPVCMSTCATLKLVIGYTSFPDKKLDGKTHEVDLVGLGCCLISTKVFEKISIRCERDGISGQVVRSEDRCFCEDAKANGYKILFDTDVVCKHIITGNHWNIQEA